MSPPVPGPPAALPLLDLLEALRAAGLPIGVREHLTVGRLLARWTSTDVEELRAALAAVLARNPQESQVVREAFDHLYPASTFEEEGGAQPETTSAPPPPFWRRLTTRWAMAVIPLLMAVALGLYWEGQRRPPGDPVPPTSRPTPAPDPEAPPPPRIEEREARIALLNWWKAGGLALLAAAVGLALVYRRRTEDAAHRLMRRRWTEDLDALPGPATYDLKLTPIEPPFRADLLDDVASVLGRHVDHTTKGDELDVERTLERTLRAGMAPQVVWQVRALSVPVLVLEDVGSEMWPWRHRVAALLDGLAARGVALERWHFDADAGRLFQVVEGSSTTLRQLARRRSEHPLLVISTGQGIREGDDRKTAAWVPLLRHWRSRAWLHPVSDLRYWRAEMKEVGVFAWPMTPQGVLSGAQQLARGEARLRERRDVRIAADRPVAPLDVERLRWLVSLAPRQDPELAELLRQRFCPHVPQAALLEALAGPAGAAVTGAGAAQSPSGNRHPGVGPSAEEVHAFLAAVLADSEPPPGTAAHARWKVDRALQALRSGQGDDTLARARRDLADLARGPAASIVEDATTRAGLDHGLERDILSPLERRAEVEGWVDVAARGSRAWTRPRIPELVAALVCGAIVLAASPRLGVLTRDAIARGQEVYRLELEPDTDPARLRLERRPEVTDSSQAPDQVDLVAAATVGEAGGLVQTAVLRDGEAVIAVEESGRERWYWARSDRRDEIVALSNAVWVGAKPARAADLVPPTPTSPAPTPPTEPTPTAPTNSVAPTRPPPRGPIAGALLVEFYADTPRTPNQQAVREPELPTEYTVTAVGGAVAAASRRGRAGARLSLEPGEWVLTAAVPGAYRDVRQNLTVRSGDLTTLRIPIDTTPKLRDVPNMDAPAIYSVSPDVIDAPGSIMLTLRGANFDPRARVEVKWSGLNVSEPKVVSAEEIVVPLTISSETPSGSVGLVIQNPDGQSATASIRIELGYSRPEQNQGPSRRIVVRTTEPVTVEVGCEEEKIAEVEYGLRGSEEYVEGRVEIIEQGNLSVAEPLPVGLPDAKGIVIGRVRVRGPDFYRAAGTQPVCNRAGVGQIRLSVSVALAQAAQAN